MNGTKKNAMRGLEDQLNKDEKLRGEFLKDPVKILKREGLELTPAQAKSVKDQFEEMQLPKSQALAAKPKIGIKISITIKF